MRISTLSRFILLCGLCFVMTTARAQYVALPDTFFGYWLYNNGYSGAMTGSDSTGYMLDTSSIVINAASLNVNKPEIKSLEGLEYFKNLHSFSLTQYPPQGYSTPSSIAYIPSFASTLISVKIYLSNNTNLTALPTLPTGLDSLTIAGATLLDSLPNVPSGLTFLNIYQCRLAFQNYYLLPSGLLYLRLADLQPVPYYNSGPMYPGLQNYTSLSILTLNDQAFTFPASVTHLDLNNSYLILLPTLPPSVDYLLLDSNYLSDFSFDSLGNQVLNGSGSYGILLPAIPATDTFLSVNTNGCTGVGYGNVFPPLPVGLKYLYANNGCWLSYTPFANQSNTLSSLLYLDVSDNPSITAVPPTGNVLRYINASYTNVSYINASDSMQWVIMDNDTSLNYIPYYPNANQISLYNCRMQYYGLLQLPPTLLYLNVGSNPNLNTIPALDSNLYYLNCSGDNLSSLPNIVPGLQTLDCSSNPNLTCLPDLRNITALYFGGTGVTCVPSYGVVSNGSPPIATYPVCLLNNPSGCASLSSINGVVYSDRYGANCQYDSYDYVLPNVRINLYQGTTLIQQTVTRQNGVYGFNVPYGTYTVELDTTSIYPLVLGCGNPDTIGVTVNSTVAGISNADFSIVCGSGFDLTAEYMSNGTARMRPASTFTLTAFAGDMTQWFNLPSCANAGGVVQMSIYGSASYAGPAPGAQTPTVSGNQLTWNVGDFAYANNGSDYNVILQIDTHAHAGDQICVTLYIDSTTGDINPSNNVLTQCFTVISSYDPNLKEVSPAGYVQVADDWLTYTIHFQNTGTDTAFNITVTDQLDPTKYDLSTFTMLGSSGFDDVHLNNAGLLTVLFPYIDLVDSLVDPVLSQGWFQFKIKPLGTVPNNVSITNSANIFFDYNPPVATDTVTNITVPGCYSYTMLSMAHCRNDTILVGSAIITAPGHYIDTLLNVSGCDSIVDLTVYQNEIQTDEYIYTNACSLPYVYNNMSLTVSGSYPDTLTSVTGCDSIDIINVYIDPYYEVVNSVQACTATPYVFYGQALTSSGVYSDTIPGASGSCDTLVTLYYSINPQYIVYSYPNICQGDTFYFEGSPVTTSGWYADTVSGGTACDTIYQIYLSVNTQAFYSFSDTICPGSTFAFGDSIYSASGVYSYTVSMPVGCDSVNTLYLTVLSSLSSALTAGICAGDSFVYSSHTYRSAGTYIDTLTGSTGCDSIVTLTLAVNQPSHDTIYQSICSGDSFVFGGTERYTAGSYSQVLTGASGCDSTITLDLSVKPLSYDTIYQSICSGDSFVFGGTERYTAGSYSQVLTGAGGCDSTITLDLSVKPLSYDTIYQSICSGDSFVFGGTARYTAGSYSQVLTGAGGCDSTITLDLSVKPLSYDTIYQSICSGDSFVFGGTERYTAGSYSQVLTGAGGCDSTITLDLSVKPLSYDTIYQSICSGDSFVFGGAARYIAGYYSQVLTGAGGCDSTVTLDLSVKPLSYDTIHQSICSGDSFVFGGTARYTAGYYSQVLTGTGGCDSTVTLNLTVKPLSYDTIHQSICSGDSFVFGGSAWYTTGYYWQVLTGAGGCDSTVTLNLTVKPLSYDTIHQSICSGDSFVFGGTARYTAGYYSQVLTGAGGCDSIASLDLTVNPLPNVTLTWDSLYMEGILHQYSNGDSVWCIIAGPDIFRLSGGMPLGGIYSGLDVQNDTINFSNGISPTIDTITYLYTDRNGCFNTATNKFFVDVCEGINNISTANTINLYPNPNHGSFTLETSNAIGSEYTISDMLGKVITQDVIKQNEQVIEVKGAAEGVYTLVVKGSQAVRFVIVR